MSYQDRVYGIEVAPSDYAPEREIIAGPETAPSGNVILRVGRENGGGCGWHQVAHVVLEPAEAIALSAAIGAAALNGES